MSPRIEKKLNKLLIGAILGTTILGVGASMTPKGKSFRRKARDFVKGGVDEIKKMKKKKGSDSDE